MDPNRVEGSVEKLAGKAEQAYGEVMDDPAREASGRARQAAGEAKNTYGQAMDQICALGCEVRQSVTRNPLGSLMIAAAAGYIFAVITRR